MKPLVFALTLALITPLAFAETGLVFNASFETPIAGTPRTPKSKGGDIANQGAKPDWVQFEDQPVATPQASTGPATGGTAAVSGTNAAGGGIVAGVTSEMARSGEQCLYLEATNLSVPYAGVAFASAPIKIVPGKEYTVGIWGRNDPKTPLVATAPQLFLKLQVDFFSDAGTTQTGDSEYLLQALPGGPGITPTFTDNAWRQLRKRVVAPADANYMTVTYRCDCSPDKGSINGVIYFDDVTVQGEIPSEDGKEVAAAKKAPETVVPEVKSEAVPAAAAATPAPQPTQTPKARKKRKAQAQ